ncbi:MAG: SocA family protein [Chitinispirillales bacterium]|jgi:uncharacterized phage-associated protein|nr:SocA family protein [Chitinispirillales bacterium]
MPIYITAMADYKVCTQAIYFLLKNLGELDKLKMVKLIYFADKLHLINYGRTITGDNYVAMRHGPAGSMVLDVINYNAEHFDSEQLQYIDRYLQRTDIPYVYKCKSDPPDDEQLSKSDKDILALICGKLGKVNSRDLVELTHCYPEWTHHEKELGDDLSGSAQISIVEFFTAIKNDPLGISNDMVNNSKKLFLGEDDESII